ncbi:MAG TPA: hypothetical protein VFX11_04875 [Candidatus Kapabacteria bacterium]|nr:hypothetical protein [Candidatus Kapabacteria bacterium]
MRQSYRWRMLVLGLAAIASALVAEGFEAWSTLASVNTALSGQISPNTTTISGIAPAATNASDTETQRLTQLHALHARLLAQPNRTEFQQHLLDHIQAANRFPPNNRLFAATELDPVINALTPDERQSGSEDGRTRLTLRCDKRRYLPGETATIQAFQTDVDSGRKIPAQLNAQLILNENRGLGPVKFADPDGDRVYTATLSSRGDPPLQQGRYKVRVSTETNITDAVAFTLTDELARLTGRYRDHIGNGHLVLEAEVQSETQGSYFLRATLYADGAGGGLFTQQRMELTPGRQWVALSFHGYLFQQRALDGPYRLQNITLQRISFPASTGTLSQPGYRTRAYNHREFSAHPYLELAAAPD